MAGYKTGGMGCEKYRSAAQFIEFSEPPHGSAEQEFLTALRPVEQACVQVSAKDSGNDGVDAHTRGRPLDRQGFCQGGNGRLACAVSGDLIECDKRRQRADVNNASIAMLH